MKKADAGPPHLDVGMWQSKWIGATLYKAKVDWIVKLVSLCDSRRDIRPRSKWSSIFKDLRLA